MSSRRMVADLMTLTAGLDSRPWHFARAAKSAGPQEIAAIVAQLERSERSTLNLLIRELLRTGVSWPDAMTIILTLESSYAWGSKQKRAALRALASRPPVVEAMQSATVAGHRPHRAILAVLSAEGSESSLDALLPVLQQDEHQELLAAARTHAADTPLLREFFEQLERSITSRERASPATAFIGELVGASVEQVSVNLFFEGRGTVWLQGRLTIDSAKDPWWQVSLSAVTTLPTTRTWKSRHWDSASGDSELRRLEDFPSFLQRTGVAQGVTWAPVRFFGSLRGKKRQTFIEWATGPKTEPEPPPRVAGSAGSARGRSRTKSSRLP